MYRPSPAIITRRPPNASHITASIGEWAGQPAKRLRIPWDFAISREENHRAAAEKLAAWLGYGGEWHAAELPASGGYVFCKVSDRSAAFTRP